ncbi:YoaK family protein [Streptomyces violaceoruber]|uniref:YoaK family protein n=1 Tax=Streptomyces violaceoruber TaxID=1935 RepID=UPI00403CB775
MRAGARRRRATGRSPGNRRQRRRCGRQTPRPRQDPNDTPWATGPAGRPAVPGRSPRRPACRGPCRHVGRRGFRPGPGRGEERTTEGNRRRDPPPGSRQRADTWAARLLTFSAGAVNAWGFLALGGVFTSVVTANSALTGVGLGGADPRLGALAAVAVLCYVLGAAGAGWAAGHAQRGGRLRPVDFLLLELVLLWAVVAWWLAAGGDPSGGERTAMLGILAAAMGCQNAGVRVAMGAQVPTAYLTGLLTGAVTDAVTSGRVQWPALVTTALLILGAAAAALLERLLPGAAPLLPALLVTAAWLTGRARTGTRRAS